MLGLAFDQGTKEWALHALADGPVGVIGDWFQLRLVFNPGAAFSTGAGFTSVFTLISTVAAVVVLWLSRRLGSRLWAVGFGLLLAGVLGNLFDRVFRQPSTFHGHVVDFLSFGSFPVFNVADMCINVAAGVIILQTFRGVRLDGTREGQDDEPVEGSEHDEYNQQEEQR